MFAQLRALLGLVRAAVERVGHQLRFLHQFTLAQNLTRVSRDWTERCASPSPNARRAPPTTWSFGNRGLLRTPAAVPATIAIFWPCLPPAFFFCSRDVRQRLVTLWHLRVAPASAMTPHLATIQYNEMLRLLARRGIRKGPARLPWSSPLRSRTEPGRSRAGTDHDVPGGALWRANCGRAPRFFHPEPDPVFPATS